MAGFSGEGSKNASRTRENCFAFHCSSTINFSANFGAVFSKESRMPISELLVTEYDQEMANTRKALERVPAEKWDWKPHPKSGTLGWMASHIATLPHFAVTTIKTSDFEIEGGERPKVDGHSRLLPVFDEQLKKGHDAIAGVTDEQLREI